VRHVRLNYRQSEDQISYQSLKVQIVAMSTSGDCDLIVAFSKEAMLQRQARVRDSTCQETRSIFHARIGAG